MTEQCTVTVAADEMREGGEDFWEEEGGGGAVGGQSLLSCSMFVCVELGLGNSCRGVYILSIQSFERRQLKWGQHETIFIWILWISYSLLFDMYSDSFLETWCDGLSSVQGQSSFRGFSIEIESHPGVQHTIEWTCTAACRYPVHRGSLLFMHLVQL